MKKSTYKNKRTFNYFANHLYHNNIKNAKYETLLIFEKVLKKTKENIIANENELNILNKDIDKIDDLIKQRCQGKPLAQILNYKHFWKDKFYVSNKTLIPRPETEIIIDLSIKYLPQKLGNKILDICTGSGCLLLSLLREFTISDGIGIDISKDALSVAIKNAKLLGLIERSYFIKKNIRSNNANTQFIPKSFNLIVSNPPYIAKEKIKDLPKQVREYEPRIALEGGKDGFVFYKHIFRMAKILLNKEGILIIEHEKENNNKIDDMFENSVFKKIKREETKTQISFSCYKRIK